METVGHHLQLEAIERPVGPERDLFGRSSYNRYYYATFLCVRDLVTEFDPKWRRLSHSEYPSLLRGRIVAKLRQGGASARRLNDRRLDQLCKKAVHAASELSVLMEKGLATRVIADYHPEIPVDFSGSSRFELNSVDITEAHSWPSKARTFSETIQAAWKQINV